MKTQIGNLINGAKNVIRDFSCEKYETAKQSTSHIGYAGTNIKERQEIAMRVYEENGDTLHIIVRGIELRLKIHKSFSGKSWWWQTELTDEQYSTICKTSIGVGAKLNSYSLIVNDDCTVCVHTFHRRNECQTWKPGYTHNIDEAFVTIL